MTTTVKAIYENGVLRPAERLPLPEGATVEVTVTPIPADAPPLTADEWARRVRAARSVEEWAALANACPVPDDGYDVIAAMNETRRANGERLLTRDAETQDRP